MCFAHVAEHVEASVADFRVGDIQLEEANGMLPDDSHQTVIHQPAMGETKDLQGPEVCKGLEEDLLGYGARRQDELLHGLGASHAGQFEDERHFGLSKARDMRETISKGRKE